MIFRAFGCIVLAIVLVACKEEKKPPAESSIIFMCMKNDYMSERLAIKITKIGDDFDDYKATLLDPISLLKEKDNPFLGGASVFPTAIAIYFSADKKKQMTLDLVTGRLIGPTANIIYRCVAL